jgi:hypothetical protein
VSQDIVSQTVVGINQFFFQFLFDAFAKFDVCESLKCSHPFWCSRNAQLLHKFWVLPLIAQNYLLGGLLTGAWSTNHTGIGPAACTSVLIPVSSNLLLRLGTTGAVHCQPECPLSDHASWFFRQKWPRCFLPGVTHLAYRRPYWSSVWESWQFWLLDSERP